MISNQNTPSDHQQSDQRLLDAAAMPGADAQPNLRAGLGRTEDTQPPNGKTGNEPSLEQQIGQEAAIAIREYVNSIPEARADWECLMILTDLEYLRNYLDDLILDAWDAKIRA